MLPQNCRCARALAWLLLAGLSTEACLAKTLLEAGAATEWKFWSGTNPPPTGWRNIGFDDRQWSSGKAPLGYGQKRVVTRTDGGNTNEHGITTWFRRELPGVSLQASQGLVLLLCVDDGAAVFVNGKPLGRFNLPRGEIGPSTLARRALKEADEGYYLRLRVPPGAWHAKGTNVVAVEVHQASTNDNDCFFDLALKTLPPPEPTPKVPAAAQEVMNAFRNKHHVGPESRVPDGYVDGGRHMQMDTESQASSGREILLVDREHDTELSNYLAFARQPEVRALGTLDRAQRLAEYIDRLSTPPGGRRWIGPAVDEITKEFANKPLRIGDVIDQCQSGVCRHRSLLFKLLGDEAGLKTALVRGNYAMDAAQAPAGAKLPKGVKGFPHAWNEVELEDGTLVLVDVMHNGGKRRFLPISDGFVVQHYLKPDDTPWYTAKTLPKGQ
jgi:Ethylene-responsive protein kinase Le-CTR1/Beta-galactosidase jelly roll domain